MTTLTRPILYVALVALMIDSVIEIGLIGTTVHYLHLNGPYDIEGPNGPIILLGKPANIIVDQGHTSNGAAGTALILVGFLGLIILSTEPMVRRWVSERFESALVVTSRRKTNRVKRPLHHSQISFAEQSCTCTNRSPHSALICVSLSSSFG